MDRINAKYFAAHGALCKYYGIDFILCIILHVLLCKLIWNICKKTYITCMVCICFFFNNNNNDMKITLFYIIMSCCWYIQILLQTTVLP